MRHIVFLYPLYFFIRKNQIMFDARYADAIIAAAAAAAAAASGESTKDSSIYQKIGARVNRPATHRKQRPLLLPLPLPLPLSPALLIITRSSRRMKGREGRGRGAAALPGSGGRTKVGLGSRRDRAVRKHIPRRFTFGNPRINVDVFKGGCKASISVSRMPRTAAASRITGLREGRALEFSPPRWIRRCRKASRRIYEVFRHRGVLRARSS